MTQKQQLDNGTRETKYFTCKSYDRSRKGLKPEDRKTDKDKNERKHRVERFYDGCDVFGQVRELIIVWTAFQLIYIQLRDDRTELRRQMAVQPLKTLCYLLKICNQQRC